MGQVTIVARLRELLAAVGVDGCVHARAIDGDAAVGLVADEVVVAASVFKVAVAVELLRRAAAGEVDLAERCRVRALDRTPGPTGLSAMRDDAELSLRDLAQAMLAVSDNAATDVIIARLGLDRINATLRRLGLRDTVIVGDCAALLASVAEDVGAESWAAVLADWSAAVQARMAISRALTPSTATRTTAQEMTRLLAVVWRDQAGPVLVREQLREWMSQQVCGARLASGFPRSVRVCAKSGGLFGEVRNEVGVVEYPTAAGMRSRSSREDRPARDRGGWSTRRSGSSPGKPSSTYGKARPDERMHQLRRLAWAMASRVTSLGVDPSTTIARKLSRRSSPASRPESGDRPADPIPRRPSAPA